MTVYIIVLHYKNIKETVLCLKSIANLRKDSLLIKVLLVDNGSNIEEMSLAYSDEIPNLTVIKNPKNLGFAAGINVGIREALKDKKTDYILILNNDTIIPANLLLQLFKSPVDIVSPVIKFKWGRSWKYDFGGRVNWLIGRTEHVESANSPMSFRTKSRNLVQKTSYERDPSTLPSKTGLVGMTNVDYISGCCMLVHRKVFEKIGLFDERYFFYFEDVDFCLRAKKAGFIVMVDPSVVVYHKLGGSIGRWTNEAIFYNLAGNFIFISKHLGLRRITGYAYLLALTTKIIFDRIRQNISL